MLLEWQTGLEVDNLGFNLYREVAGKRTLITPQQGLPLMPELRP